MGTCSSSSSSNAKMTKNSISNTQNTSIILTTSSKDNNASNISFSSYYNHIQIAFRTKNFTFCDQVNMHDLTSKLAIVFGITPIEVQTWIECYLEYMIYLGYIGLDNLDVISKYSGKVPYGIGQIWKIHTVFGSNYNKFSSIVTDGKLTTIPFAPIKTISCGTLDLILSSESLYNDIKKQILDQVLYPQLKKSMAIMNDKTIGQIQKSIELWSGDFYENIMKYELNYCVMDNVKKNVLLQVIDKDSKKIRITAKNIMEIMNIHEIIRELYYLESVVELNDKKIPNIQNEFLPNVLINSIDDKDLCSRIDNLIFPKSFMKILCIEQLLTIRDTLKFVLEYKKFLFLLHNINLDTASMIIPSSKINQVWQLHLQFVNHHERYTQNIGLKGYNDIAQVINDRNRDFSYNQTLLQYKKYFGNPPRDIWPRRIENYHEFGIWKEIFTSCYDPMSFNDLKKQEIDYDNDFILKDIHADENHEIECGSE